MEKTIVSLLEIVYLLADLRGTIVSVLLDSYCSSLPNTEPGNQPDPGQGLRDNSFREHVGS